MSGLSADSVESGSARVWTTPSNASAYSNSKESRISSVFGNSRAVAYARVSSKRQAEEGVVLDAQVNVCLLTQNSEDWN